MTIQALINQSTPPLKPSDTVEHALGLMMELRVRHLPVVNGMGLLLGVVSEDQLLDASGPEALISSLLGPNPLIVEPDAHVFDVTKIMVRHDLTTVPVATEGRRYAGLVRRYDIFDQFARMLSTQEAGAILAIEVDPRDYSLSQLVYFIEQNDVKILSIATETPSTPTGTIRITLKLNVSDTSRVRHVLEHHGYHVVASFSDEDDEELQFRVQEFMRYLEV
ncbi:MAG: CBS domain-containing protein [Rhodothermales bacterium]